MAGRGGDGEPRPAKPSSMIWREQDTAAITMTVSGWLGNGLRLTGNGAAAIWSDQREAGGNSIRPNAPHHVHGLLLGDIRPYIPNSLNRLLFLGVPIKASLAGNADGREYDPDQGRRIVLKLLHQWTIPRGLRSAHRPAVCLSFGACHLGHFIPRHPQSWDGFGQFSRSRRLCRRNPPTGGKQRGT